MRKFDSTHPGATCVPSELTSKAGRARTVLILRGTGLNLWHYHRFLERFSLEELAQFRAIYGVSGGAVALWFNVLGRLGLFNESSLAHFDYLMRTTMNRYGLATRLWKMATKKHPYQAGDNYKLLLLLASPEAAGQTFRDFPLRNFSVVAREDNDNTLLLIGSEAYPQFSVPRVLSYAVTTSMTARGTPLFAREPYHGLLISDFDFANQTIKKKFRDLLSDRHAAEQVIHINIARNHIENSATFIKVSTDRLPRIAQALDFLLFFMGIPNPRYLKTFLGSAGCIAPPS